MRAEGWSYTRIANALRISKATCSAWERELKAEVAHLQQEQLNELFTSYGMEKQARVRRIGETLRRIDAALEEVDFAAMPPEKLLDLKLKYARVLKEEYTGGTMPPTITGGGTPEEVRAALVDVYARVRSGDIGPEQAEQETKLLASILAAYRDTATKEQLDALDTILRGKGA